MDSSIIDLTNTYYKIGFSFFIIGVVGNGISFVVFSRKQFRRNSINVYCRALAIVNSLVLLIQFPLIVSQMFYGVDLYATSDSVCKFTAYVTMFVPPISAWILVCFSLDKLICVMFPHRFEFIHSRKFQLAVLALNVVINAAIYVAIPVYHKLVTIPTVITIYGTDYTFYTSVCLIQTLSFYRALIITYLVVSNFVPFFIMIVSSFFTVRTLITSRHRIEVMETREKKNRRAKDLKFAVNSIVLDVLFVVFQTPISVVYLVDIPDMVVYTKVVLITGLFYFINYIIPLFTYILSNSLFRREMLKMMGLKNHIKQSKHSTAHTANTRKGTKNETKDDTNI